MDHAEAIDTWRRLNLLLTAAESWWPPEPTLRCSPNDLRRFAKLVVVAYEGEIWSSMDCADWKSFVTEDLDVRKPWNAQQRAWLTETLEFVGLTHEEMALLLRVPVSVIEEDLAGVEA